MELFGIQIDTFSREKTLARVSEFLNEERFHRVITLNPEFLVESERNQYFKENLRRGDLVVADGFGIVLAGKLYRQDISRFPGADLLHEVLKIAEEKRHAVALIVREGGLSSDDEIRAALLEKYPKLELTDPDSAAVIFCNYGAPEQEFFIEELRNKVRNNVRLGMGVGGSFDYLTGKVKRAPLWMRTVGLEWFWRLLRQPKRVKRIWNAIFVFSFLVFTCRISKKKA